MAETASNFRVARRTYLFLKAIETVDQRWPTDFTTLSLAVEAVSSVAIEHPEWDMDERRTWDQWEASR